MHLRQVKNKKTGRTYLSIVQSYRGADGKVRSKTLESLGSLDEMGRLTAAWEADRNARARTVEWRLAVDDARERLAHLYPKIELEEKEK